MESADPAQVLNKSLEIEKNNDNYCEKNYLWVFVLIVLSPSGGRCTTETPLDFSHW